MAAVCGDRCKRQRCGQKAGGNWTWGYGNKADDPNRLAEHVSAVLALAPSSGRGSDANDDFSVDRFDTALHITFSDEMAHGASERIEQFVIEVAKLESADRADREDRDLVIAELARPDVADAVVALLDDLWSS